VKRKKGKESRVTGKGVVKGDKKAEAFDEGE
jgi:hypothetical protein